MKGESKMTNEERKVWEQKLRDLLRQKRLYQKKIELLDKVMKEIAQELRKGA